MTGLLGAAGYVGIAIDYLRGKPRRRVFHRRPSVDDIAAQGARLGSTANATTCSTAASGPGGFGVGGAVAVHGGQVTRVLRVYIVSTARASRRDWFDGGDAPIKDADHLRAPLLLILGGADELVTRRRYPPATCSALVDAGGKKYEIEIYPNVGHSFFRQDHGTIATREIADAWDRVQAYLGRLL